RLAPAPPCLRPPRNAFFAFRCGCRCVVLRTRRREGAEISCDSDPLHFDLTKQGHIERMAPLDKGVMDQVQPMCRSYMLRDYYCLRVDRCPSWPTAYDGAACPNGSL